MTTTERITHRVYDRYASGLRITSDAGRQSERPGVSKGFWVGLGWSLLAYAVVGAIVLIGLYCLR